MKKIMKWLIAPLIVLLCGNVVLSQSISEENKLVIEIQDYSIWQESNRNIEIKEHTGINFFYTYNLPDVDQIALAFKRVHPAPINNGYAIIQIDSTTKNLKALTGKIKFSGSDIDETKDTLIIAAHYSKFKDISLIDNLNKGNIPKNANLLKISEPILEFESFNIDLLESINNEEKKIFSYSIDY